MAAKLGCPEEAAQAGSPGGRLAAAASFPALQTRSAHHALMSALAGSAPAFPAAARLAHRWLAAQMLSNHICPEAAELLTAAVFSPGRGPPVPGWGAAPPPVLVFMSEDDPSPQRMPPLQCGHERLVAALGGVTLLQQVECPFKRMENAVS